MAKKSSQSTAGAALAPATDSLLNLDPAVIMLGDNVRFGLLRMRIDSLKEEILDANGVKSPIEVVKLSEDEAKETGKQYKVLTGNYRTTAVQELNDKDKAGLLIPALIREVDGVVARIKRQIAENVQRQDMTPMDSAGAIKSLIDAGESKINIRKMFPRATGKKLKMEPASNSWLNMMLSFLDFPKDIQNRIHDGRIPVKAAYELRKEAPENWKAVVETIEANRLKDLAKDEKQEERFLTDERKRMEAEQKQAEADKAAAAAALELAQVKETAEKSAQAAEAAKEAVRVAYEAQLTVTTKTPKDQRKKVMDDLKSAEAAKKQAEAAAAKVTAQLEKLEAAKKKAETKAAEKDEPETPAAPPAAVTPAAPVTSTEVQQAAQQVRGGNGAKLDAKKMREVIHDLTLAGTTPKVLAVCILIESCFDGKIDAKKLYKDLKKALGE